MEVLKTPKIQIKHDGELNIAIGASRKELRWRNVGMLWSDFVKRISTTNRTAETYEEYQKANKARQDEIKDVGGFVGGFVNSGRRKNDNITNRQMLTLDVDFGKLGLWEDFLMLYGCAGALYTTHKHTPNNPRYRLLIPLNRPVFVDEYQAIARRVAGYLDINVFDDTTFEPARLMFWPSTSKDAEYVFEYNDGPWLDADEVLSGYINWQDSSSWPVSDRVNSVIRREMKKQGDPLTKPGLIGAFCRTYTIKDAIETYLKDVYSPCADPNRYTYIEGSTAAGLVLYDDIFAFSHHGTDPISGKLCNAFDLVRLHMFGLKDEDAKEDTASNRLPSYTAMVDMVSKIPEVRKMVAKERILEAMDDFDDTEDIEWMGLLDTDRKGNTLSTIDNILIIIENDSRLKGCVAYDAFRHREEMIRSLPWRKYDPHNRGLTDTDDAGFRYYLEKHYDVVGTQKIRDALDMAAVKRQFHPVKDYLEGLTWDGVKRLDNLLIDYLGAANNDYTRAVARKTFTAAVARIYQPGIKFDYVLTLVGPQGIGKSTLIKKLGKSWYSDSLSNIQGKEACEQLQGVWLVELGELAGLKKAEIETIKHFISKQEDIYRVAYGRRTENFPRQCLFIGTTNNAEFLRDKTGNRRFWVVDTHKVEPTKSVFDDLTDETIGQIWAEAIEAYKADEPLYLSRDLEAFALEQQAAHSEADERVGMIQEYLDTLLPEKWSDMDLFARRRYLQGDELQAKGVNRRERVCVIEIWCELLEGTRNNLQASTAKELRQVMAKMEGWKRYEGGSKGLLKFGKYGPQIAFVRSNE